MRIKIGLIQMKSVPLDVKGNLARANLFLKQAVKEGAELIVLPEMFSIGFQTSERLMPLAEKLDQGETISWARNVARKNNIYVICSLYEYYQDDYYNTMVLVGPDGNIQYYRKRNPTWMEFIVWRRSEEPGPAIFDTPFGCIGGAICFDSFAKETFLGFKNNQVSLAVIVACWGVPQNTRFDLSWSVPMMEKWSHSASRTLPEKYAKQLKIPVVFANQSGMVNFPCVMPPPYPFPKTKFDYKLTGNSSVWDCSGNLIMDGEEQKEEFAIVIPLEYEEKRTKIINRIGFQANYLNRSYYYLQPPKLAKFGQFWCYKGFKREYSLRKVRCSRQNGGLS